MCWMLCYALSRLLSKVVTWRKQCFEKLVWWQSVKQGKANSKLGRMVRKLLSFSSWGSVRLSIHITVSIVLITIMITVCHAGL